MRSPYGPGRCAFCSEPATSTLELSRHSGSSPVCGSCAVAMGGHATSLRGVDARDAKTPEELARRRRQGGERRFRQ